MPGGRQCVPLVSGTLSLLGWTRGGGTAQVEGWESVWELSSEMPGGSMWFAGHGRGCGGLTRAKKRKRAMSGAPISIQLPACDWRGEGTGSFTTPRTQAAPRFRFRIPYPIRWSYHGERCRSKGQPHCRQGGGHDHRIDESAPSTRVPTSSMMRTTHCRVCAG